MYKSPHDQSPHNHPSLNEGALSPRVPHRDMCTQRTGNRLVSSTTGQEEKSVQKCRFTYRIFACLFSGKQVYKCSRCNWPFSLLTFWLVYYSSRMSTGASNNTHEDCYYLCVSVTVKQCMHNTRNPWKQSANWNSAVINSCSLFLSNVKRAYTLSPSTFQSRPQSLVVVALFLPFIWMLLVSWWEEEG